MAHEDQLAAIQDATENEISTWFVQQNGYHLLSVRNLIQWLTVPSHLLLLDLVGAILTALVTGLLLTTILPPGLPWWFLLALSITAAGYACVDFVGYRFWPNECWPLTLVGILNLLYCAATMAALLIFLPEITSIGVVYFSLECAILIPLAIVELVIARDCRRRSRT